MRIAEGFDKANKIRRRNDKRDICRHFVLWGKLHYKGKSLEDIICKITGIDNSDVDYRSKIYWIKKTCKMYKVEGYSIIKLFIDKSHRLRTFDNELEQMLSAMRARLQGIRVKEDDGTIIWDLGEADLFEEE